MRFFILIVASLSASAFAGDIVKSAPGQLHIGWAHRDITPSEPVNLAGQFHIRITKEVDSPVTLTALALETRNGDQSIDQAIIMSCDVVGIPDKLEDKLRKKLEGKLPGFDLRKIVLNATHTHTAPDMGSFTYKIPDGIMKPEKYNEFFLERAADAAIECWQQRKPGSMTSGMGYAVVGYNRRMTYADGTAAMYGDTKTQKFRGVEGHEDHSVETLFFFNADRKLTGVAVNVACPSQFLENQNRIAADYWHDVRIALREKFSNDLFVLPLCSAAGDQSPHPQFHKAAEARMRNLQGKVSECRAVALRIRDAVSEAYEAVKSEGKGELSFNHHVEDLKLPSRKITENDYRSAKALVAQFKGQLDSGKNPAAAQFLQWHGEVLSRYEMPEVYASYTMELHVMVLGDVAIATNPFELFIDYGNQMKARSHALQTVVVQLAAGVGGYLPTERAVSGGGYSAIPQSGNVGPEGGQMMVDRTVEIINSVIKK